MGPAPMLTVEKMVALRAVPLFASLAECFAALAEITRDVSRHGRFNYLLSNGDYLFAHCYDNLSYVLRHAAVPQGPVPSGSLDAPEKAETRHGHAGFWTLLSRIFTGQAHFVPMVRITLMASSRL